MTLEEKVANNLLGIPSSQSLRVSPYLLKTSQGRCWSLAVRKNKDSSQVRVFTGKTLRKCWLSLYSHESSPE